jgi:hypothetical protein
MRLSVLVVFYVSRLCAVLRYGSVLRMKGSPVPGYSSTLPPSTWRFSLLRSPSRLTYRS